MNITRIVGIDPGSRITGYGIIQVQGNRYTHIESGTINTGKINTPGTRLHIIYQQLNEILTLHQPTDAAIEQVFMQRNVRSALVLGQARGAALVALAGYGLPIMEYSPRQVKQSVVGYGNADKQQIQHMVCRLLNLQQAPSTDAADALGIAICHAHNFKMTQLTKALA
jgi:crossover junction endodeoxyribonuclease RuvC